MESQRTGNHVNQPRSRRSRPWLVAAVLLLAGLSCALPSVNLPQIKSAPVQSTAALAVPAAAPSAQPSLPAAGLSPSAVPTSPADAGQPPVLAEVQPPAGSDLGSKGSLLFYFSTPMDRESVQRGTQIDPAVPGRFDWQDDATLRVSFDQPLPPDTNISLTFNNNVRSQSGKFLTEPVQVHYRVEPAAQAVERLPRPNTSASDPSAAVAVTFNRPVVPLVGEVTSLPAGFTLQPAAQGRGEWLNTSTYVFYPQPALSGGTTYAARLNTGLGLDAAQDWTFTTALPQIVKIEPDQNTPIWLDAPIVITFNQPMDTSTVQENFVLQTQDEARIAGKFTWSEDQTRVSFQPEPPLARDTVYALTIAPAARSQGGTPLASKVTAAYKTVPALAVSGTQPAGGELVQVFDSGYGSLDVTFTAPLAEQQDFTGLIRFSPEVPDFNAYLHPEAMTLTLSGAFEPSVAYTLTLAPGLKDRWGQPLGNPVELSFTTAPTVPSFRVPMLQAGPPVLFSTTSDTALPARASNISLLDILSSNLNLPDFFAFTQGKLADYNPAQRTTWQQALQLPDNRNQSVGVNLTEGGSAPTPGIYYYSITSPQITNPAANGAQPFMLVVSDIHMVIKRSAGQVFLWAYDFTQQANAARLAVSLYDANGNPITDVVTDDQGIARADLPAGYDPYGFVFAVSGKPGDPNFSLAGSLWNQGLSGWEYELPVTYESNLPEVYLYTDRPIYRPGQKVYFRGIARAQSNGRYTLLDQGQVAVKVLGVSQTGDLPVLFDQDLALDEFGAFSGELDLPSGAQPGTYFIQTEAPVQGSLSFQVAEYRKPEIELRVQFPAAEQLAGQDLNASLQASYYFGAPAGRLPVSWTLRAQPGSFSLPEGFQTGKIDTGWLLPPGMGDVFGGRQVAQGQGETAADGSLQIIIPSGDLGLVDLQSNQRLVLEVTAQDESQQPVSARSSITLHPASFYIGIRPGSWSARAGEEIGFDIQTVDWQRSPSGGHNLHAVFQRVVYRQQAGDNVMAYPRMVPEYTEVGSADFKTDASGQARLAFAPDQPGTYQLTISGENALSETQVWAGGQGSAPWPQLPNQHLKLVADASSYRPGDTAKVLIPNPFSGGAQALITVERGNVMRWQVLELQGASATFDLPLKDEDAPNIYLSVTLLNRDPSTGLDFRQGYLELDVDPGAALLQVQAVVSPEKAAPGQDVNLSLQVQDAQGQPVEGEFSVALIDKSVLALADPNSPEIKEAFYGRQPLGVQTSLSTAAYTGRIPRVLPGRGGGGAQEPSTIRQQFADTAYWNAQVRTDAEGKAVLTAKLPDNLTTWVLDTRGITKDSRVGSDTAELVTSKDLLVRPAVPRFLVAGDRVELAAVVNNNTGAALQVDVSIEAEGVTLEAPNQAAVRVEIPAGDRRRVAWTAVVQSVNEVNLLFRARSGALEDAARPDQGALPVLKFTATETFATAGTLSEPARRAEWVSLPRSFQPQGGALRLELTPSLASAVISGVKTLDSYPTDFSESALSRLLANLEAYQALQKLGVDAPDLKSSLDQAVRQDLSTLVRLQNQDGSWGWMSGSTGDAYITAYIVFGLGRVKAAGIDVPAGVIENATAYLTANTGLPAENMETWQLDRLLFQSFALQQAGQPVNLENWYAQTQRLSPWSNALLAVMLASQNADDARANEILSRLQESAERSATGARWSGQGAQFRNFATPVFTTAAVVYALAKIDPASPMLIEGVRYLVSARQASGGWFSSYDTAWTLMALVQALQGTGDLQARYEYAAALNGAQIAAGSVNGSGDLSPVQVEIPIQQLNAQAANELAVTRGEGTGRLYYRAFLQVDRPARDAAPLERGLSISRSYTLAGADCRTQACPSLTEIKLASPAPVVEARLTVTVPNDLTNVVVEDYIPAGAEILNVTLNTSQQQGIPEVLTTPEVDARNPFGRGWGWWLFHQPQIYDSHIRWFADSLPAGTYQLTYRLVMVQAGEYQVLPARAYAYYFPEIQGSSAGEVFKIQP